MAGRSTTAASSPALTGKLSVDTAVRHNGKDSLRLEGNFTKGGGYVQAGGKLPETDIREISFWLRDPGGDHLTLRIDDGSGQCHQINLKIQETGEWQPIVIPLARFFAKRGTPDAVPIVAKYEFWGGANDGNWHGPGKRMFVLLGASRDKKLQTIWLSDVRAFAAPARPATAAADIKTLVRLDQYDEAEAEWTFDNGQEFPGALGSLAIAKDQPAKGQSCLVLAGDFTRGGNYVQTMRSLKEVEMKDLAAIRLKVKSDNVKTLSLRLIDGTDQCHQRGSVPIVADGKWHDLILKPDEVAGGEHWGGANDGKWHGPAHLIALIIGPGQDRQVKQPVISFTDIRAEILEAAVLQPASFNCDFESATRLPGGWTGQGKIAIDKQNAFKGRQSLVLEQPAEDAEKPCSATTAAFAVTPGLWEIGLACKSDLKSPDNSFNGLVSLECLNGSGKTVDTVVLADLFGRKNWQPISKRVELPKGVASARFHVQLNKASGRFWIDEISAAYVSAAPKKDNRVDRILFATAQMGNLLYPEDERIVKITVVATKWLDEKQKEVSCVVRDYWGAEQGPPVKVPVGPSRREGKNYVYNAQLDLGSAGLEVGRYYELHADIAREGDEPFHNYTSLAILPPAAAKNYKPAEIPFTSRSWDNRIGECFYLSDRLGVRICGIWGGWSADPPYEPYAPTIELCEKLSMGVLTGAASAAIEHHDAGWEKYDEKALRQGVRNWIAKYGKVRPLMIDLGNEPPLNPERVRPNIAAYKAIYEEVKKIDPSIVVIASSMGPIEEYFQNGFQNYCDVVDFHAYEDWSAIPGTFKTYERLFAKYGGKKPIWSTEIGLNSQGMVRQAVATTLVKKLTLFFACGGQNISWFDLMYPDNDAKLAGTSSEAHNIFDARYCRYCPKLDAVAYYNMVNGICDQEVRGAEDLRREASVPSSSATATTAAWKCCGRTRAARTSCCQCPAPARSRSSTSTGGGASWTPGGKGLTLTVTEDPVLLLYEGGTGQLPDRLETPPVQIASIPDGLIKGVPGRLAVSWSGREQQDIELIGPPTWTIRRAGTDGAMGSRCHLRHHRSRDQQRPRGRPDRETQGRRRPTARPRAGHRPRGRAIAARPGRRRQVARRPPPDPELRRRKTGRHLATGLDRRDLRGQRRIRQLHAHRRLFWRDGRRNQDDRGPKALPTSSCRSGGHRPLDRLSRQSQRQRRLGADGRRASGRWPVSPPCRGPPRRSSSTARWPRTTGSVRRCRTSTRPGSISPTTGRRPNGRASRTFPPRCSSCGTTSTCTWA